MHTDLSPNHPGREWFEELCALAAIGEVSSSEFDELRKHLAECGECRQVYSDFRQISGGDIGLVAALKECEQARDGDEPLDERAVLGRLLDRAKNERILPSAESAVQEPKLNRQPMRRFEGVLLWLRRPVLSYGSLGLILCALAAVGAYRLREQQLTPKLDSLNTEVSEWKNRASGTAEQEKLVSQELMQVEEGRERLRQALADAEGNYANLKKERLSLESELASLRTQFDQRGQELQSAKSGVEEKDKEIGQLEARVRGAVQRTEEQRKVAEDLQNRLQYVRQQELLQLAASTPEAQGFGDAEAKALFGARDLHIVDVYDVDSSGATKRTYGRVYYVEKRLLMFYAFDLQNKGRSRAPASFQAWGYRQANEGKPENLGLFSVDDASANRWVLRVNNPRVLEHIDAVFVTAESPNGSPSPRGRRVLYANLAGPANHP
jgi:hypothetical protein